MIYLKKGNSITMKNLILLTLSSLFILGCSSQNDVTKSIGNSKLINSVWRQETKVGEPPICYIELKKDGVVGYNEEEANHFDYSDDDSWHVKDNILTIVWTNGYTIDEFPLTPNKEMKLVGTQNIIKDKEKKGKAEAIMYRLR